MGFGPLCRLNGSYLLFGLKAPNFGFGWVNCSLSVNHYLICVCFCSILFVVKSYGTEDRPTDRPIPPKDEVYEFIIFRGADIKSIDVVEPPKSATALASGLSEDPAIVQVSNYVSLLHFDTRIAILL